MNFVRNFIGIMILLLILNIPLCVSAAEDVSLPTIRIGILAYRPKPLIEKQWEPLIRLLQTQLPQYVFHMEVLTYPELNDAVSQSKLDFVLTNSGHYILLKKRFGLTSPLCTLAVSERGHKMTHFAGVIFTREESSFHTLKDLNHPTIAFTDKESLGGYQMQALVMRKFSIFLPQDASVQELGMPHDNVVYAVLSNRADIGFVRSGVLEKMADEKKIDLKRIRILNVQPTNGLPIKFSTPLYPEWPLVALPHIDEQLSRRVLAILFQIEDNGSLARSLGIYGFNIPADYSPVEDLLRELRVAPFDDLPNFSLEDIWLKYTKELTFLFLLASLIATALIFFLIYNNRKLKQSYQKELKLINNLTKFSQIIEQSPISIMVTDLDGVITYVNHKFSRITGFAKDECIGKNPNILKSDKTPTVLYKNLWDTLKRGDIWEGELVNQTKDKREYIEWGTIAPLRQEDGKITNYVGMKEDITDRKKDQALIHQLAFYDQLTTLPNRQQLNLDIQKCSPKSCIILNIDAFKEINDFFGIAIGDDILKQVALWLLDLGFSVYRTGGDEFTILLYENLTQKELEHRMNLFLLSLDEKIFYVKEEILNLRMSAGCAFENENLLTHADIALHIAKEKKMNFYVYFEQENVEKKYRHNIEIASTIRKALLQGKIICHYQPIVDVVTKQVVKYECLVRMIDENAQIIAPNDFLPIAKKMKIYTQITHEVVYQACTLFKESMTPFSINLSMHDLEDERSLQQIFQIIFETNTASRIIFEILETEGIENYESVQQFIARAKALGIQIAIDDFGTGYSNFEHILRMNLDYIKIDGSLIQGIMLNQRGRVLVASIVNFAHSLGIKTVAEYVSDEVLFNHIKELGIDFAQGFYIGKPTSLAPYEKPKDRLH